MLRRQTLIFLASFWAAQAAFGEIETIRLPAQGEVSKAEVFVRPSEKKPPLAVLVLCPGQNGSGEEFLRQKAWMDFADRENLALAAIYFQSSDEDLRNGRGYFVASRGAGKLLEEGLRQAGLRGIPVLLYGFSGGAHFVASYAAWHPQRVIGFCAYSFGWWQSPPKELKCPALIVCGQADGIRYGSTFAYFQAGRRQDSPWAWVSLRETAHEPNGKLDDFVREYFACVLRAQDHDAVTVDNMTKHVVKRRKSADISTSVLPCAHLLPVWQSVHHP